MQSKASDYDWAGGRGAQWRDQLDGMEAMLSPVDVPFIEALALDAPYRIAEIACGGGGTTRAIAAAAPAGSEVTGFDISPDLVAAATARAGDVARFVEADASTWRPERPFDRLASRFGVMFFDDPAAAFANLRHWLAPGGRLAFAVWGPPGEVGFMAQIRAALAAVMHLPPADPDAPGPCRYGDSARLVALLDAAGFHGAASRTWRGDLPVPGGSAQAAADFLLASSSSAAPLADASPALRDAARASLTASCASHIRDGQVWMPVRVEIVTATG
ncbi:class I SAM-dependent methyltransferase [Sphingomonas sp. R-74633]|uniref:class I SAM-dependent methyltransferase n=1 Tax=Sphingomonas sp. R-74633 TaxID=2751188 RepID=UPI0015D4370E|nr:class I SAM-dependent methyltransferase [Sphingomonas sp. R-74633]NYT40497.1 class I SAM-dependent methyltransferase [Sphingomonas sp. R-74633]